MTFLPKAEVLKFSELIGFKHPEKANKLFNKSAKIKLLAP